jgi:hypothetical protein
MRCRSFARLAAFTLFAAVMASGSSLRAEDSEMSKEASDAYFTRVFAGNFGKQDTSYACFVRRYDADHLAKHNLQKVSSMLLLVSAEKDPEDKTKMSYSFRLGLKFRNRAGNFDSSGYCAKASKSEISADKLHIHCGVDCDGGGISVELSNKDKSTLIRLDSIRIWKNNKPEEEGFSLSGGADDRVFRLDRASNEQCKSLVTDRKELAAMRTK